MEQLDYEIWDVFTEMPFGGNPLAIVHDADGLSRAQMLTLAREFNLSETIFVMAPRDAAHRARVRIFFPTDEIPFAGHPTIGCAICLADLRGDGVEELVLEEEAGLVPVRVEREGNVTRAEFAAPVLPQAAPGRAEAALCAQALGLEQARIGCAGHAGPVIWQGGPTFLYVPLRDLATLGDARPCEPAWSALMQAAGVDSAWCYTPVPGGYQARMFSPTAGIPEDPATGSASAIFAAELHARGLLAEGETRVSLAQGVEMGRASEIGLRILTRNGALDAVHVAGRAVWIAGGKVRVPG